MLASAPTRPSEASAPSTALTLPAQTSQPPAPTLVRYETMCRAIAECHRIDEVKDLRDQARALEVYAQQARNTEAEDKAREIRNRAHRRMGELLKELPRMPREERGRLAHADSGSSSNDGTNSSDQDVSMLHDQTCSSPYADALKINGISRYDAHCSQKLADIPEKDFEEAHRDPSKKPTTARLIRKAYKDPLVEVVERIDPSALWIWGRALDFEREGYPSKQPDDLFQAMTPEMQEDMRRLVPVLTDFYQQFSEVIR